MVQSTEELDAWYRKPDPWGYRGSDDDARRVAILLGELPVREYRRTLDIGCGEGFVTSRLPGTKVVGVDISPIAIERARAEAPRHHEYRIGSILSLDAVLADAEPFDLVVVTGVLYPQYIGHAASVVVRNIDRVLAPGGVLCSVHIADWCRLRFPYLLRQSYQYQYREYEHRLEIYLK